MLKLRVKLEGLENTLREIDKFSNKIRKRVLKKACRAAARQGVKITRRGVPVQTGQLKKKINLRVKVYRGTVVAIIGPRTGKDPATGKNPSKYAHLVELGTKPHLIRAAPGGGLKIGAGGQVLAAVRHPGSKARPFMARSFAAAKGPAERAFIAKLKAEVAAESAGDEGGDDA